MLAMLRQRAPFDRRKDLPGRGQRAQGGEDADFEIPAEYKTEPALKVGQNIVGLASAFDEAFASGGEEWSPGQEGEDKK